MLAKQLWWIVSYPDSLHSRLLRHKYIHTSDVLTIPISQGCSFTWRNTLEALPVSILGSRWQLCDGKKVGIWLDRWVPRPISCQVIINTYGLSLDAIVDVLMEEGGEVLNDDLVCTVFQHEDAELILNILLEAGYPDVLRWLY
ncbi:UNVERIFIED_CONTAM: hypothetical protein Sradi_0006700 [Sesamum radiatum]|uniref:Uncharacterized protein n=1 Tax=Sesamum radiatum TaxID=300843 RepID=A0AAW2WGP4_SESRA